MLGEISTFVSPQPASLLLQRDHAAYYLSSKSLFTVVEGQSQQDLLHNAIMFQGQHPLTSVSYIVLILLQVLLPLINCAR